MVNRFRLTMGRAAGVWAALASSHSAEGHGIAGNRYFPGTLTFDDPAVADELVLQPTLHDAHSGGGAGDFVDNTLGVAFARLLTSRLAIGADSSWTQRSRTGSADAGGFAATSLTLKGLVYENDPHETLLSAALSWRIGGSGSEGVGAGRPAALEPGVFFGRGLGDLPDSMAWLRPLGIAGAVSLELPTHGPNILHWGFALEYSTLYLTSRFTGEPPTQEPLHQLVPLVELSLDAPLQGVGGPVTGTVSPGLSYVGKVYQLALELAVPIKQASGRGVAVRMQLLFFLDDLLPALLEKPVWGGSR